VALFTKDSIERVREAADMVEIVGAKTDLRRVGSRWQGLCPFHEERTPSFGIDPERKLYHCFGCGASGDVLGFVMETEALDFPDAVERLADRYGLELEREEENPEAEQRRRRRERLLGLLERTARFYAAFLWDSAEAAPAREYLAGRGLSEEVLRDFRVGWAPSAWDRVASAAVRDGFSEEELRAADLARRARGGSGLYDRFRARITFPLADSRGRTLGFGARRLDDGEGPKYLNTAEGELYHKGRQLFGIDRARAAAAKAERIVVVEGYTDVLALHQAGVAESVAIMGTALTAEQLSELARAAPRILLALDADSSGQEAIQRAATAAADRDVELRAVPLPAGADPADLVADGGAAAFSDLLEGSLSVHEFELRRVLDTADLDSVEGRDRALGQAGTVIARAQSLGPSMRDELLRTVSDRLDVPIAYVQRAAGTAARPAQAGSAAQRVAPGGGAALSSEHTFLALCLASGGLGRGYLERLDPSVLSSDSTRAAREHLLAGFDDPLAGLSVDDRAIGALVAAVVAEAQGLEPAHEAGLRVSALQLQLRSVERDLRGATRAGDRARQAELATARQDLKGNIDEVMSQTV
jgi:DNA primase